MIGHIEHGSNFGGLFRYLLATDKGARIIGGNAAGETIDQLTQEFNNCADQRRTTTKPVKHFILSFAPEDGEVQDNLKHTIATQAIQRLGYIDNQYLVIDHQRQDPGHDWNHDHDHIHIAVNMITLEGQRVDDWQDKRRFEAIIRELELEHRLTAVAPSQDRNHKSLTHGQVQKYKRQLKDYQTRKQIQTPDIPISVKLQAAIDAASLDQPTMTIFIGRLQQLGIDVMPIVTETGRKRISYLMDGAKPFRGSKLHNGSFPKLISQRGINFDLKRDQKAMSDAVNHQTVMIPPEQLIDWSQINLIPYLPNELPIEELVKEQQKKTDKYLIDEVQRIQDNQGARDLLNEVAPENPLNKSSENPLNKSSENPLNKSSENPNGQLESNVIDESLLYSKIHENSRENQEQLLDKNIINKSLDSQEIRVNYLQEQEEVNKESVTILSEEKALINSLHKTPEFSLRVLAQQQEYTLTIAPIAERWLKAHQIKTYQGQNNLIEYESGTLTIKDGQRNYKMIAQAVGVDEHKRTIWQCVNLPLNSPGLTQKDVEIFTNPVMKEAIKEIEQKMSQTNNQSSQQRRGRRR